MQATNWLQVLAAHADLREVWPNQSRPKVDQRDTAACYHEVVAFLCTLTHPNLVSRGLQAPSAVQNMPSPAPVESSVLAVKPQWLQCADHPPAGALQQHPRLHMVSPALNVVAQHPSGDALHLSSATIDMLVE
jgi:hypothetical protein